MHHCNSDCNSMCEKDSDNISLNELNDKLCDQKDIIDQLVDIIGYLKIKIENFNNYTLS